MKRKSSGSCTTAFPSETSKIRSKVLKYLTGKKILDFGCGTDKVVPHAIGIDMRNVPGVDVPILKLDDVYTLEITTYQNELETFDAVYSSHFLEHLKDDKMMLKSWIKLIKPSGYLVLYLPDDAYYNNAINPEHFQRYRHLVFVQFFRKKFPLMEVIDHGPDIGPDRYSFYMVAQKIDENIEKDKIMENEELECLRRLAKAARVALNNFGKRMSLHDLAKVVCEYEGKYEKETESKD